MSEAIDLTVEKDGGVLKTIKKEGTGTATPSKGCTVFVHYTGTLLNGEKFDSSRDRNEPFHFQLGQSQVIKGWDLGVATMKRGEICDLVCKSEYAYGESGSPPKIPGGATLKFEIELLKWEGEDISPDKDGSITRIIIAEGEKQTSPVECSKVTVHAVGTYMNVEFYNRDVTFLVGEGSEVGLPEGVDRALRRFNKREKSIIHLKGHRYTYGSDAPKEYNLPENAEIDFTVFLKDVEKAKATWELTGDEKLAAAEESKARGTKFLKENKYKLALAKYARVKELLEYECSLEGEKQEQRNALILASYLNSALAYLKTGETLECIKSCDKALEVCSTSVKALYRKASALQQQNDIEEAISVYKKVLELEPENKAVSHQIAVCKQTLHNIREKEKKRFKGMFEKFAAKQEEVFFAMANGDQSAEESTEVKTEKGMKTDSGEPMEAEAAS
uniref:peptidylprolyl isomerase n=1 Tax=Syphacia muris TaxID=451379 RepID=A0A0N5APC1_9BILA